MHDHGHAHGHGHGHVHSSGYGHATRKDTRRLLAAFAVIASIMVVEIVGGLLSGSLALLADATHMFADAAALGLAAGAHLIARRPADLRRHFGYQRAQVLAAFFNGATLVVLMLWIVSEAVQRLLDPVAVNATLMLNVAIAGLLANALAFWLLHSAGSRNVNIRGALLHVAADLLSSIAAILGALLIMWTGIGRFDPILSILVAALVGISAVRLLKETGHILLEGAPKDIDIDQLKTGIMQSAPGVEDVHDIRIWQITPDAATLTLHARIADAAAAEIALDRIKAFLEKEFGIRQSTVQIEIGDGCPDCEADAPPAAAASPTSAAVGQGHPSAARSGDMFPPPRDKPIRTALAANE
jgi:cobalt-zinc-cadmium efflux system protein